MPDQTAGSFVAINGLEIINSQRTLDYVGNYGLPINISGDCWCPCIKCLLDCDDVVGTAPPDDITTEDSDDLETETPDDLTTEGGTNLAYSHPSMDNAPWYDASIPESGDFLGFLPIEFEGLGSTFTRKVFDLAAGGAVLGRLRAQPRTLTWRGLFFGRTSCSAEYGLRWLTSRLAAASGGCSSCSGAQLDILYCCVEQDPADPGCTTPEVDSPLSPPGNDDAFRTFYRVGLVDGPKKLSDRIIGCKCCARKTQPCNGGTGSGCSGCTPVEGGGPCPGGASLIEAEFSLVAGNPYMHKDPITVCESTIANAPCQICEDIIFAPISMRSSTTLDSAGGPSESVTINVPAGVQAGDVLIATIEVPGFPTGPFTTPPTCTGWTVIANGAPIVILQKTATSSEPSSYTFAFPGVFGSRGGSMSAYVGVDTTVTNDSEYTNGNSTTATTSAFVTSVANSLLIAVVSSGSSIVPTNPTGMTQRLASTGGSAPGFVLSDQLVPAGTTAAKTSTVASAAWGTMIINLTPRAPGANCDVCGSVAECDTPADGACLIDPENPDCNPDDLPVIPEFIDPCRECAPVEERTVCCYIDDSLYGPFFEGVLNVELYSGSEPLRNVAIRVFENPQGRTCEDPNAIDPCNKCDELVIRYVPAFSTLTVNGIERRVEVTCPGEEPQPGESLTISPFSFPVLSCSPYLVTASVDCSKPIAPEALFRVIITPREM